MKCEQCIYWRDSWQDTKYASDDYNKYCSLLGGKRYRFDYCGDVEVLIKRLKELLREAERKDTL